MDFVETSTLQGPQARDAAVLAHLAFEDFYSIFSADPARVLPAIAAQFAEDSELNQLVAALDGPRVTGIASYYAASEMGARQAAGMRTLLRAADDVGRCMTGLRGFLAHFTPPGEEGAYISRFAVDPGLRGSGLATGLLSQIERAIAAKGLRDVRLHVRKDNARGVAFYRKNGYDLADDGSRGYLLLEKRLGQ